MDYSFKNPDPDCDSGFAQRLRHPQRNHKRRQRFSSDLFNNVTRFLYRDVVLVPTSSSDKGTGLHSYGPGSK
jgi:hypothetical protein